MPGRELFKRLLKLGVIVRPLDEYGLSNHVRISIGLRSQNKALLSGLAKALRPS
jgi:histidinol-phosphate aminotransferase